MATYIIENQHDVEECNPAFEALEGAAAESAASVRDDTLLCTCPHGSHGGSVVVEAEQAEEVESFARRWDVGETTVKQLTEMEIGGE